MPDDLMPLSFRFPPDKKAALLRAAKEDSRSLSSMIEKILTDWLLENGHIKAKAKAR